MTSRNQYGYPAAMIGLIIAILSSQKAYFHNSISVTGLPEINDNWNLTDKIRRNKDCDHKLKINQHF